MVRLFLLDGTALAYRSHFALARSGLSRPDGRPTGAVYGFAMTLRRLLEKESPDLIAVAMDAPGPTFRHARYAPYKATRERAPEEMLEQLDDIREVVRAHGIALFEIPGYEADDVIGTLARRAERLGHEVLIVTGDKDFMQLVSDRVQLYNVFKKDEALVIEGPEAVRAKFGTDPAHVVDVLAIMGDSSDNVPGVHGIGEKGAIKLIEQFGSVAGLLERLDEVPGKTRERIAEQRAELLLSRELVTIDTDVPLAPGLEVVGRAEPERERLVRLFRALDFQSMVRDVAQRGAPAAAHAREYTTIVDEAGLAALIAELRRAGEFAFDTETTGLSPLDVTIVGFSFSTRPGSAHYLPFQAFPPVLPGGERALLDALRPVFSDRTLRLIGQNAKYDALVLAAHGVEPPAPAFDTMVASYCVAGTTRRHNLDDLALHYFGLHKIPISDLIGTGRAQVTMAEVAIERVAEYACEDADVTLRLKAVLEEELEREGATKLFRELEMPLVPVLTAMERRGIRVDPRVLVELERELRREMDAAEIGLRRLAGEPGLNVNSPKMLGTVLFEKLRIQEAAGVKRPRKTKTGWATDHATLEQSYGDVPIVRQLLAYREVAKLKSTYVDALPQFINRHTGRIHCHFSQTTAATGRLASSDPNLQNIPVRSERGRRLREAFVPRASDARGEWVLLSADYSQVELRIMAHLSGDQGLERAFAEGRDIHAATASVIFEVPPEAVDRRMRSQSKAINFGLLYGMGPQRLARDTGLSVPEAKAFIERYFGAFPRVREWIERTLVGARATGYVETLLGRRRAIPDIRSENQRQRAMAENMAVNTPVQGSAADIIKRAMIHLERELGATSLAAGMLLQVHDELVLEVPLAELEETTAIVRRAMEQAVELSVPLVVDCGSGPNWLAAH